MTKIIQFPTSSSTPAKIIPFAAPALTPTAQAILDYLRNYIAANGISPSYREVASGCYTSASNVQRHIATLAAAGYITYEPKTPRSIRLCEAVDGYEGALWVALADVVKSARDLHSSDQQRRLKATRALNRAARLLELREDFGPAA